MRLTKRMEIALAAGLGAVIMAVLSHATNLWSPWVGTTLGFLVTPFFYRPMEAVGITRTIADESVNFVAYGRRHLLLEDDRSELVPRAIKHLLWSIAVALAGTVGTLTFAVITVVIAGTRLVEQSSTSFQDATLFGATLLFVSGLLSGTSGLGLCFLVTKESRVYRGVCFSFTELLEMATGRIDISDRPRLKELLALTSVLVWPLLLVGLAVAGLLGWLAFLVDAGWFLLRVTGRMVLAILSSERIAVMTGATIGCVVSWQIAGPALVWMLAAFVTGAGIGYGLHRLAEVIRSRFVQART